MTFDVPGFSRRLKEAMDKTRVSSTALALMLDVSAATVSGWLTGRKTPSLDNLVKISEGLNVSLCWIMHNRGPMNLLGPVHLTLPEEEMILKLRAMPDDARNHLFDFLAKITGNKDGEDLVNKTLAHNFIHSAKIPVLVLDKSFSIVDINEAYKGLLNLNQVNNDRLLGNAFTNWIDMEYQADALLNLSRARHEGQVINFFCRHIVRNDAKRLNVLLTAVHHDLEVDSFFIVYAFILPNHPNIGASRMTNSSPN